MYVGKLAVVKVGAVSNLADLLTKHLKAEAASRHLERCDYEPRTGRASSALGLMAVQEAQADRLEAVACFEAVACTEQLVRQNRKPRLIFFMPIKVAGGRRNAANVGSAGVSVGSYADRRQCCKDDNRNTATHPHETMSEPSREGHVSWNIAEKQLM